MPYILVDDAVPIVGLRPDEKHVRNLEHLDMASLVVRALFFRMCCCCVPGMRGAPCWEHSRSVVFGLHA
jgi:hypothetical protein